MRNLPRLPIGDFHRTKSSLAKPFTRPISVGELQARMDPGVIIYGAPLGMGGLGMQAATALRSLTLLDGSLSAIGPGQPAWPFAEELSNVRWLTTTRVSASARIFQGRAQYRSDCEFGRQASEHVSALRPNRCYGFTQISRESASWCRANGVPFILDNPNGHIRNMGAVYRRESWRWCSVPYFGHPTNAMVARVEAEYSLATRIRVSSHYSKETMVRAGVPSDKIEVIPQFLDLERFRRSSEQSFPKPAGPLRVCFVGSLDLRKGFVYLLRAIRKIGRDKVTLRIVGNTGDPWCKRLFNREASGLDVALLPGDPVPTYHWAEVSVAPSLEDGFGFVVAEAMASGVAVIVSNQCGAAEWVQHGTSGWIAPSSTEPTGEDLLAQYLQLALDNRSRLAEMGHAAAQAVSQRVREQNASLLSNWFRLNTLMVT
jgi:glycosyltransferase involved in cell wall biosynthesis